MIRTLLAAACILLLAGVPPSRAQQASSEAVLPLDGAVAADGRSVELSWFGTEQPHVGSATIRRRRLGETGPASWRVLAASLNLAMRYTDHGVRPGTAYEYQVTRTGRDLIDVGYWVAGTDLPALAERGQAHLVVDETVAEALGPRLARFESDLAGDGWQVSRLSAPRGGSDGPGGDPMLAAEVREALKRLYYDNPFARHAVILLGHPPVVLSGRAAPDGHEPRPHATDLFYADMDGRWSIDGTGAVLDNRVPGDSIEMQVGRIDFAGVSGGDPARELHLLRAYLDKDHHWRQGRLGDLRQAYGQGGWLRTEIAGLGNVVGPDAVTVGGHHDAGEAHPWLWGVDFGDWNGGRYAERHAVKAVFAINFGSGKQTFEAPNNAMTALLAQPWYSIAVGWGARPAWWLHPMALGGTIGDVHMATVNNGVAARPYRETMEYYPTGEYLWRNPVWVNLLGDPTLHAFVLAPPARVRADADADADGAGVTVSWAPSPDPDADGYGVWRRQGGEVRFKLVSGADPLTQTLFHDPAADPEARYMVRATGLKRVHAGSFHTLSQGAFAEIGSPPLAAEDRTIAARAGETLVLPEAFDRVEDGIVRAFVEGPQTGTLTHDGMHWLYRPPAGFAGNVTLRYSVSDALRTDEGRLTITVGP